MNLMLEGHSQTASGVPGAALRRSIRMRGPLGRKGRGVSILVLLLSSLSMPACLSILPGSTSQTIELNQRPEGVHVQVIADGVLITEAQTPARIELRRAPGYVFRFSKPGYRTRVVHTWARPGVRMLPSCLLSIFSLGMGWLVDLGTGAMTEIDTSALNVTLDPETPTDPPIRLQVYREELKGGMSAIRFTHP